MSIQSEITRISGNVSDALDAIAAKGVTVPSGSNSDDLATLIAQISSGSGGSVTVVETQDSHGGTIVSISGTTVTLQAKTVTPSTSQQVISPDSGYTGLSQVTISAVETASHPDPTITVSSAGLITASHVQSTGYVTGSTTTATQQLSTQAAATITPTKSSQTAVASGKYTTGAVTVAAIPAAYQDVTGVTAAAGDVVSGKDIVNSSGTIVHGSLVIQHYYTGSGDPSSSLGSNGDIYLKTS